MKGSTGAHMLRVLGQGWRRDVARAGVEVLGGDRQSKAALRGKVINLKPTQLST